VLNVLRRIGGPGALISVWALTTVPAGFSVYILRTVFTERWTGSALASFIESPAGTVAVWLVVTLLLTAWGLGGASRRA